MNTKRLLVTMIVLNLLLIVPLMAVIAQELNLENTPKGEQVDLSSHRLWSGAIQFSDNNSPDSKPRIRNAPSLLVAEICISEETDQLHRRHGGCVE